jgi:hypothetical protein
MFFHFNFRLVRQQLDSADICVAKDREAVLPSWMLTDDFIEDEKSIL